MTLYHSLISENVIGESRVGEKIQVLYFLIHYLHCLCIKKSFLNERRDDFFNLILFVWFIYHIVYKVNNNGRHEYKIWLDMNIMPSILKK